MSYWTMYCITRLDAVNGIINKVGTISIIALIVVGAIYLITKIIGEADDNDNARSVSNAMRPLLCATLALLFVSCLAYITIPTTKQAIAIWAIPKVINNEQVQALPDNALKLINAQLQEWLKDVSGEVTGEVAPEVPGK